MHLYAQQPYWLMKDGIVSAYRSLDGDMAVDVAIIGAGISGALVAHRLKDAGISMAIVDRRHAGMGSTAASTAFLQYEIDTPLHKLAGYVGMDNAVQSYRLCREAIYTIGSICKALKPHFDFHIRPSLHYASYKKDVAGLYAEYELRRQHGFDVRWLESRDVADMFGIDTPGAILSADGGEVDAYMLTHALLAGVDRKGHSVFNNTNVQHISRSKQGFILHTNGGKIKAKKIVIAAGYESLKYIPKTIAQVHTTYALVSEPIPGRYTWYRNSLVWETANPYIYFRMLDKDRVLIGGKDDPWHHPRLLPSAVQKKTTMLQQAFHKRMAHIRIKPDFSWGGAFAVTKDGLPYIGTLPGKPGMYFALGYGGNGITFSVIAAEIIHDLIQGRKNVDAGIFGFNR